MTRATRAKFVIAPVSLIFILVSSIFVPAGRAGAESYAGRWDLTITDPASAREMPSWLEIESREGANSPRAQFVGRWGSARSLPKIEILGPAISFVSPREEEGSTNDLVFHGILANDRITGTAEGPNATKWTWIGVPAPALPAPRAHTPGLERDLFNGLDFSGWKFDRPERAGSWAVEQGCLVNHSAGANLITRDSFADFRLQVEVNCPPGANSGIYLRGRYEVQVEDDSLAEPPSHHMGAIYGFLAPHPEPPRRPGQWQAFDITLRGRVVTVTLNGRTIIDHEEIPGITGGALDSHEELPGPIYLQGDHGGIAYRNLKLTPL
ncbi:MAG TPA: DUF1080 domain-containing protein [Verrucomicrobiae bacterium]|jgi:hypothetical protein|nr:DUF1080 domain-containing protein [Verrucomicrobiae bacterium]